LCWGNQLSGAAISPSGFFTQISCGEEHTCALEVTGSSVQDAQKSVVCWGLYNRGELSKTVIPDFQSDDLLLDHPVKGVQLRSDLLSYYILLEGRKALTSYSPCFETSGCTATFCEKTELMETKNWGNVTQFPLRDSLYYMGPDPLLCFAVYHSNQQANVSITLTHSGVNIPLSMWSSKTAIMTELNKHLPNRSSLLISTFQDSEIISWCLNAFSYPADSIQIEFDTSLTYGVWEFEAVHNVCTTKDRMVYDTEHENLNWGMLISTPFYGAAIILSFYRWNNYEFDVV
jgi:hypothetical protein